MTDGTESLTSLIALVISGSMMLFVMRMYKERRRSYYLQLAALGGLFAF